MLEFKEYVAPDVKAKTLSFYEQVNIPLNIEKIIDRLQRQVGKIFLALRFYIVKKDKLELFGWTTFELFENQQLRKGKFTAEVI